MSEKTRRSPALAALSLLLLLALPAAALAQSGGDYTITKSVIAGGGGTSAGAGYTLSGTVGQHAAGILTGGGYTLEGGYWGGADAAYQVFLPLVVR